MTLFNQNTNFIHGVWWLYLHWADSFILMVTICGSIFNCWIIKLHNNYVHIFWLLKITGTYFSILSCYKKVLNWLESRALNEGGRKSSSGGSNSCICFSCMISWQRSGSISDRRSVFDSSLVRASSLVLLYSYCHTVQFNGCWLLLRSNQIRSSELHSFECTDRRAEAFLFLGQHAEQLLGRRQ